MEEKLKKLSEQLKSLTEQKYAVYNSIAANTEDFFGISGAGDRALANNQEYQKLLEEIRQTESAIIECLFGFHCTDQELQANGFVTDKKKAIEMLCETSFAWRLLDDSLKRDPDVIMYYQPLGYKHVEYSDVSPEECGICASTGSEDLGEAGFKPTTAWDLEENGLISNNHEGASDLSTPKNMLHSQSLPLFMPEIAFPEGFDYETYFQIQAELRSNHIKSVPIQDFARNIYGANTREDENVYSSESIVFDRSRLDELVKKYYTPSIGASTRTIGVNPLTTN